MNKKLILIAGSLVSAFGFAQVDTIRSQPKDGIQKNQQDSTQYPEKTCVTMHNGQVMMLQNGAIVPMEDAKILQNGTIVMLNGMVKTKEGKVSQMNEGDCLDMFGDMLPLDPYRSKTEGPPKNK
jgi:hypothetical protein